MKLEQKDIRLLSAFLEEAKEQSVTFEKWKKVRTVCGRVLDELYSRQELLGDKETLEVEPLISAIISYIRASSDFYAECSNFFEDVRFAAEKVKEAAKVLECTDGGIGYIKEINEISKKWRWYKELNEDEPLREKVLALFIDDVFAALFLGSKS